MAEKWDDDLEPWWRPGYSTADDGFVEIKELETNECPVSLVSPTSLRMLEQYWRMQDQRKATGFVTGPAAEPGKWPARLWDAVVVIQQERDAADEIRQRVERKTSRRR